MHTKKVRITAITLLLSLIAVFCASCSDPALVRKDGLVSVTVNDNLQHTQYWEKNDTWDFSGVTVTLVYDDASEIQIPFLCRYISFKCEPQVPSLTFPKMTEVTVYDVVYTDYRNVTHNAAGRTFPITTVPYPEAPVENKADLFPLFLGAFGAVIASVIVLSLFLRREKKKGNEQ